MMPPVSFRSKFGKVVRCPEERVINKTKLKLITIYILSETIREEEPVL